MLTSSVQSPPPRTGANTTVASVSSDVIPSGYTAIYSAEDLNKVRNNLSGKYILMNDIDLSSIDDWEPIGNSSTSFTGTFDGNGHVIKNFKASTYSHFAGLFEAISNSEIKNLGIQNAEITDKGSQSTGILVGNSYNSNINNCYVTGSLTGTGAFTTLGGLVGEAGSTTISNCYFKGDIKGNSTTGGLIGHIFGTQTSTISDCYIISSIEGSAVTTGLICGTIGGSLKFTNVWADKKDSTLSAIGKIYGSNTPTITNSGAVEHAEFTSPEFWDKQNFDSDVWEMSYSIPPVLKGIGGQEINWYFGRGSNEFRLQVGEGSDPAANAMFVNTGLDLGAINVDLSTVEGCLDASRCVKAALDAVTKRTADIGIEQSRLETISNVNTTQIENLSAAYSTVTEADVAEEVARYTKAQIMAQAASSLITQTQNFQANLLLRMISSLG